MPNSPLCWQDGRILPAEQATVSVLDHGLLYGDGVFEGIRVYHHHAFKLKEHLQRLFDSAKAIGLSLPFETLLLERATSELISAYGQPSAYIRVVLTRGVGSMGIDPRRCNEPGLFIIIGELSIVSDEVRNRGAKVIIASTRRMAADALDARIKSLNYLNNILAKMEANLSGADEAILLNHMGRVAEGSADNIFIVRDNVVLTPPPIEGALAGITRRTVMDCAADLAITLCEQALAPYDLYTADECFLTGTGAELIPVASVDGRTMRQCPGPIYRQLDLRFKQCIAAPA